MSFKDIAVIGGSGSVGTGVLDALLENKQHFTTITVLTSAESSDEKFKSLKEKGFDVVTINYDQKESFVQAFKGVDAVVSTVGSSLFGKQVSFVDAAIEVSHFDLMFF